jgi:hypothetical protein
VCVFVIDRYISGTGLNIASLHNYYHDPDLTLWYEPDDVRIACLLGACLLECCFFYVLTASASLLVFCVCVCVK